jgi:[protein-PII] uridylyltransferase
VTYADLSALSQTAWNDWKASLLRDLYDKTFEYITLGERALAERHRADEAVQAIVEMLGPKIGASKVCVHLAGLPPRYSLVNDADTIERHLHLIAALADSTAAVDLSFQEACSEIVVCTSDKPYRLSEICGVFAVNNISVLGAQVYTRDDGIVLDTFSVVDIYEGPQILPEKQGKIRDLLIAVFEGQQDIADLVSRHPSPWSRRKSSTSHPTRVIFENTVSERYTIIDIFAQDTIGFLYRITRALSDLGLEINTARISTQVDQIADSFYIFERGGGKVTDVERLEEIRRVLIERIG